MVIKPVHVDGTDKGRVMLYALSTCIHCKKTKEFLNELGIAYDYLFVDQLSRSEMDEVIKEMEQYNPHCSFPTLVINGKKTVVGSRIDEIREALGL
jgi:glutaredoxin-like protein NrdH